MPDGKQERPLTRLPTLSQGVDAELHANGLGRQLRQWVQDGGGYIHPALQLSLATPHRSRGVIALEAIPLTQTEQQPLIAIPETLLLTAAAAAERLGGMAQRAPQPQPRQSWWWPGRQQQQQLQQQRGRLPDPTLLLALLLAAERQQGVSSFWWPYIQTLPQEPPCGWALSQRQLAAELAALGGMADGWGPRVQVAAAAVHQRTEAAAAAYGQQLGVSGADVRWALAQVVSRSYGSGADLALLPYIDLCNHRQHAAPPAGLTTAAGQPCAAVYSQHEGVAQALPAGGELCVSYLAGAPPTDVLETFLNFGFVPQELRG